MLSMNTSTSWQMEIDFIQQLTEKVWSETQTYVFKIVAVICHSSKRKRRELWVWKRHKNKSNIKIENHTTATRTKSLAPAVSHLSQKRAIVCNVWNIYALSFLNWTFSNPHSQKFHAGNQSFVTRVQLFTFRVLKRWHRCPSGHSELRFSVCGPLPGVASYSSQTF